MKIEESYQVRQLIGGGTFGHVYLGVHVESGVKVGWWPQASAGHMVVAANDARHKLATKPIARPYNMLSV